MDSDSGDSDEWEEVAEGHDVPQNTNVACLFCPKIFGDPWQILRHCSTHHDFDVTTLNLDCYGYIKMVNYIRKNRPTVDKLMVLLRGCPQVPWMDDYFMIPAISDDPLLMVDMDTIAQEATKRPCLRHAQNAPTSFAQILPPSSDGNLCQHHAGNTQKAQIVHHQQFNATPSGGINPTTHVAHVHYATKTTTPTTVTTTSEKCGTVTVAAYDDLLAKHRDSEANLKYVEAEMNRCVEDMNRMKVLYRNLVGGKPGHGKNPVADSPAFADDEAYFSGYAHFGIHHEMLQDKVRTEAYRDLFANNVGVVKDKSVLDVGCGTGILSLFAARAGASHVTGIDQSGIVYNAIDIARENAMSDKITLLKGRLEDTTLPVEKYDLIVSEWMGYFLLYESMLETVLYARDRYLRPGGMVFPDRCSMSIVGIDDQEGRKSCLDFWDDVYGFKMTCMKGQVSKEASVSTVSPDSIVTQPCIIKNLDIMTCDVADLQFTSSFSLTVTRDGCLTAIAGYFDVFFERGLGSQITLTTAPAGEVTHWKQTVFYLPTARDVKSGDVLAGSLGVAKMAKDPRSLNVEIKLCDDTYNYMMP